MTIRFKCQHCQKALSVKDHLAGKKAACPVCKKAIVIPAPPSAPADMEAFAAEALADKPAEKAPEPVSSKTIVFACTSCDEEVTVSFDLGGKKTPCPHCKNIIRVPMPEDKKPKDWRTTQKGGPSAALANLPEQLSDAWGTEQKGKVSREAMEEAGALPEPEAKSLGARVWIRRGTWICLAGVMVIGLILYASRAMVDKQEKNRLDEAKKSLPQMEPLHQAEYYRAAGEIEVRNLKAKQAQENFFVARTLVLNAPKEKEKGNPLEADLFLIKLVLSQVDMGGSGEETNKRPDGQQRLEWGEVHKELVQTLGAIRTEEAKAAALRDLGCKLLDKDQFGMALGLASMLIGSDTSKRTPAQATLKALKLTRPEQAKDDDSSLKIAPPDLTQDLVDNLSRLAYTQGYAFKGDYAKAFEIAGCKGSAAGRVEACVAGAAIAFADSKNKEAGREASVKFINEGMGAYRKLLQEKKEKIDDWTVMELIRLTSRTSAAEGLKDLAALLPQSSSSLRPRAQLDIFLGQLERNPDRPAEISALDEIGEDKSLARGFAWEALARHNSRLGRGNVTAQGLDEFVQPFVHLGNALGVQDRK